MSMSSSEPSSTFGPYRLHELINSGGMSDIWLATDNESKSFALRKLHANLKFDFFAKRRFNQGCEILQKVHHHDLIIKYYGHGKIDGTLYMVMEYVEGANLKQLYARTD